MSVPFTYSTKFIRGRVSYRTIPEMKTDSSPKIKNNEAELEDNSSPEIEYSEDIKNNEAELKDDSGNENTYQQTSGEQYVQRESSTQNNSLETPFYVKTIPVITIFFLILAMYVCQYAPKKPTKIDDLKQIFPSQPNETFEHFEAVMDDILFTKAIHPAVFLFLYDSNEFKVNNIVHHLATYATERLKTNTEYIDVPNNEFHTQEALKDYGYLIDKYRSDLLDKKVMVVKNLQNIPAHVAQAFHSFCDEFSPLVERVVYIFTLKVDSMVGKKEKIAETNLKKFWSSLDIDILMPLITRVTSTVLKVLN